MTGRVPYDGFAEIYDAWVDGVPIADEMRDFYVALLVNTEGPVVELGTGNGRISLGAARGGQTVIGVDSSKAILGLCRERAAAAEVGDRVTWIEADFRDFELTEPAELIVLPFHSIGHLTTDADKLACMRQVFAQLRPRGRFVWDHFVFDPDYPSPERTPILRAKTRNPVNGRLRLIWETLVRDMERQVIEILVRIEDLADDGTLEKISYEELEMSWIDPERSRELLLDAGFEVEALHGDFRNGPFVAGSSHQVWIASKP